QIGASFHLTNVQVYVVDLKKCRPFGPGSPGGMAPPALVDTCVNSPFSSNQSVRKSFSKAERPTSLRERRPDVRTIEESTSGTDPEEENQANITNLKDYNEIFRGRGLNRTPPPVPFQEPERDDPDPSEPQILSNIISDNFEALSLDNNINNFKNHHAPDTNQYSRSKSNLDQVYHSRLTKQQPPVRDLPSTENQTENNNKNGSTKSRPPGFRLQRQSSCKDVPERPERGTTRTSIKHSVSEANITKG
ncbi:unnamed protein product, partial [Callosobruchus maculatus]